MKKSAKKVYDKDVNIMDVLREMEVGDISVFPISRMVTVRVSSSNLGLQLDRHYSTTTDRKQRSIKVIRIS